MKRLTCEMCGSTDLIKQDGVFVCQTCGCKYSTEEAKKMMVEGTVEVTGTVKVDNSAAIENYLDMARNALDASNNKEADDYCNRIIEMDMTNWEAWFIKGKAVGWQSTLGNIRIAETINAFSKALENCPEENKEKIGEDCKTELENLQSALLSVRIKNFKTHPNENDIAGLRSDVNTILTTTVNFLLKAKIMIDALGNVRYARIINNGICDAWQVVYKDYTGDEHRPSDYELTRFISEGDYLIEALKLALVLCGDKDDDEELNKLKIQIYENMIHMQGEVKNSQSYEVSFDGGFKHYNKSRSLTAQAKTNRQREIDEWNDKISYIKTTGERKAKEAADQRRKEYWENHKEEKSRLDAEQKKLQSQKSDIELQIAGLEAQKETVPAKKQLDAIQNRIDELTAEKKALGLFKVKEKKVIQGKIDEVETEATAARKLLDSQQSEIEKTIVPLRGQLSDIVDKLSEITLEFERDR